MKGSRTTSYDVEIALRCGLPAAVLLSRLVYLCRMSKRKDHYCWRSYAELCDDLGLTPSVLETAIKKLENANLIRTKVTFIIGTRDRCKHYFVEGFDENEETDTTLITETPDLPVSETPNSTFSETKDLPVSETLKKGVSEKPDFVIQKPRISEIRKKGVSETPDLPVSETTDLGVSVETGKSAVSVNYRETNRETISSSSGSKRVRAREEIPFEGIVDDFNAICSDLAKVQRLTGQRRAAISEVWDEYHDSEAFRIAFRNAQASEYLKGDNRRGWRATFDWIIKPDHFLKVLEGNYNSAKQEQPASYDLDEIMKYSMDFDPTKTKRGEV